MDGVRLTGDFKISQNDLYYSECQNKYVDLLPTDLNNNFITTESQNQDFVADIKDMHVDAGFDNLAKCNNNKSSDEDIKVQFSADVNLLEPEHSVLQENCREIDGTDVKDICIDEGLPVKEKSHGEDIFNASKNILEDKLDDERLIPVGLKSSADVASKKDFNSCESKVLSHQSGLENEMKRLVLRDLIEEVVETLPANDTISNDDSQIKTSKENRCKNELDTVQKNSLTGAEVTGGKPSPEETTDTSKMEISVKKTEPAREAMNKSLHFTASNNEKKIALSVNNQKLPDASHKPQRVDSYILSTAPLQRDYFESSFASVGHYSGLITYSGPIAHSGNLSHRSDASTVSTRSFAFPVLPNEWNFSPVPMKKADRRSLIRHRGWMNSLFCCKF